MLSETRTAKIIHIRAGELLKDLQKAVGGRPNKNSPRHGEGFSKGRHVESLGVSKKQAENWQRLAASGTAIFWRGWKANFRLGASKASSGSWRSMEISKARISRIWNWST
jgi:hypothetical protein